MKFSTCACPFAFLAALSLLCAACVTPGGSAAPSPHADSSFRKAHDLYVNGRYEQAAEAFSEILRSASDRGDEALIARSYQYRGECKRALKDYGLARFDYDMAMKTAKSSSGTFDDLLDLIIECRIARGDTYLYEGAYLSADREFKAILDTSPPGRFRDGLLYRRYICAVMRGESDAPDLLAGIKDERSFDKRYLDREFLEEGTPAAARKPLADYSTYPRPTPAVQGAVLTRADWNARPVKSNVDRMTRITKITVHHTAMYWDITDQAATADHIHQIQKNHQDPPNGWADIGYHFLVDRAGRIWEGRPLAYQGAHAGNSQLNRGNIGICLLGNFETQQVTRAQQEGLVRLLNTLCRTYGLSPSRQVATHTELLHGRTECPGKNLQAFMERWRVTG